ncbi:uncharacterized protein LOC126316799 [Schistocerca gregaria]|uniref:uncharacterized protein LOC126316799 n=1 Tax=Schistocerca gregaria TaxID=7010 RepID=UPI00211F16DC|nr:uncharacterized protein LOC126316799 [Schistocerca gregaria]
MNFSMQRNIELVKDCVNKCTNDFLFQADYEKNLEVVDKINNNPSLASLFMKSIEDTLTNASTETKACLTIELLKTILQNCLCFIPVYSKKKYQDAIMNFVLTTKYLRARDEMLQIIQMLGTYYTGESEYNFMQTYNKLLYLHHLNFPPHREIFEPPSSVNPTSSRMQGIDNIITGVGKERDYDRSLADQLSNTTVQRQYRQLCANIRNPKIEELVRNFDEAWKIATDALSRASINEKPLEESDALHSVIPLMKNWHQGIIGWMQQGNMNLSEQETNLLFLINDQIVDIMKRYDAINTNTASYRLKNSRQMLHLRKNSEKSKKKLDRRESTENVRNAFVKIASRKRDILEKLGKNVGSTSPKSDLMSLLSDNVQSSSKGDPFSSEFGGLSLSPKPWIESVVDQRVDSTKDSSQSGLLSLQPFTSTSSSPIISSQVKLNQTERNASPILDLFQNASYHQSPTQIPANVNNLGTVKSAHSGESSFFSQKQFQAFPESRTDGPQFQRRN